jgi:tRNA (cmo5U34)-methyltransferase
MGRFFDNQAERALLQKRLLKDAYGIQLMEWAPNRRTDSKAIVRRPLCAMLKSRAWQPNPKQFTGPPLRRQSLVRKLPPDSESRSTLGRSKGDDREMNAGPNVNLWSSTQHALDYLKQADSIPHRTEGEAVLLDCVPVTARRILDLGSGDGRLLRLLRIDRPHAQAVALDFSPVMLENLRKNFAGDPTVTIVEHNLDQPLPRLGACDAVVSSFAIHHLVHERKRSLYAEVFGLLAPGGVFCNLEHVASPTPALHERYLSRLGIPLLGEDPSNKLLDVETQLQWLREIGLTDVDCHWKWLELALLAGRKGGG